MKATAKIREAAAMYERAMRFERKAGNRNLAFHSEEYEMAKNRCDNARFHLADLVCRWLKK